MDRLKRFEYCSEDLFPHIEKVLELLGSEITDIFLNDEFVQIISSQGQSCGFQVPFSKPITSMIFLGEDQIKQLYEKEKPKHDLTLENYFVYGIAHEIGHHFARWGKSYLLENEANEWLIKNGNFRELIYKIDHSDPKVEKVGFEEGYNYAASLICEDAYLLSRYSGFLKLFKGGLSTTEKNETMKELNKTVSEYYEIINSSRDCKIRGFALGILKRVREIADYCRS